MSLKDLDGITESPPEWAQNLDMDAYVKRQGEACIYMYDVLDRIRSVQPGLFSVCAQIREVHRQQQGMIEKLGIDCGTDVRRSFYFDWLYKELSIERPSDNPRRFILAHAIGYLRGHERYCRLLESGREHGSLWNLFQGQAKENARMLLNALAKKEGLPSVVMTGVVVLEAEERLMRLIWEHNGLPLPPSRWERLTSSNSPVV